MEENYTVMAVVLKRPEVAELYECTLTTDVIIHIACYSGWISNISKCAAAKLVKSGAPYLIKK